MSLFYEEEFAGVGLFDGLDTLPEAYPGGYLIPQSLFDLPSYGASWEQSPAPTPTPANSPNLEPVLSQPEHNRTPRTSYSMENERLKQIVKEALERATPEPASEKPPKPDFKKNALAAMMVEKPSVYFKREIARRKRMLSEYGGEMNKHWRVERDTKRKSSFVYVHPYVTVFADRVERRNRFGAGFREKTLDWSTACNMARILALGEVAAKLHH